MALLQERIMRNLILSTIFLITCTALFAQQKYASLSPVEQLNKTYCSPLFSAPDGIYFDFTKDDATLSANAYYNVLDWLQGRAAGLQVRNVGGTSIAFIRNSPAAIFVDEIRIDPSFLNSLPVADVAMIKVIKAPFIGAPGARSAIAIYTKGGEEEEAE
jgi:hypothetical protein